MSISLRAARQIKGLTQREMAEKIGVCRHTYMKYESHPDLVPVGVARAISEITGVDLDNIFFERNSTFSRQKNDTDKNTEQKGA